MQAVIFDMDGLMIDTEKVYWAVGRQMAREFGKTVSDETLGRMMGRAPLESIAVYAQELGLTQAHQELLDLREARVMQAMRGGIETMPGLHEVLKQLRPHFTLAIATSAPGRFVDVVMASLQIRSYFDAIQTSDDIKNGKPDPEIYLKTMARIEISPEKCFVLEDSSNGSLSGKRAGAYVISVPTEHTRAQDFTFSDHVAANLSVAAAHMLKISGKTLI